MHMNVHGIGPEKVNIEYTAQMRSKTELLHSVYVSSNIRMYPKAIGLQIHTCSNRGYTMLPVGEMLNSGLLQLR